MKIEEASGDVAGMIPYYSETGDACVIICWNEKNQNTYSFLESRTVETAKRHLARCYALDLAAQALALHRDYQRSAPLPFYLHDGRIFVPFKLRMPRVAGDPSYGYIELELISRILPDKNSRCRIICTDGSSLPVFSQINTARLALCFGVEIQKNIYHNRPDPARELRQAFRTLRRYLID